MKKILVVFLILTSYVLSMHAQHLPKNVQLTDLKGKTKTLGEIANGEAVMIFFWATYCKPCIAELDAYAKIEDEWKDKIRIIAISMDNSRSASKVTSLVNGKKWPYEIYLDKAESMTKALNIRSMPYSVIVNKDGKIIKSHTGYTSGDEYETMKYINSAL